MNQRLKHTAALALLAALPSPAQTRSQTVFLSPNSAEADVAFAVAVSGTTSLCHPLFSHFQTVVTSGAIELRAVAENDPAAKCPAGNHDYQVDFMIPALIAGKYEINAFLLPAYVYSPTPCPIAYDPQYGDTLTAVNADSLAYSIRPKSTAADKAFDLALAGKNFQCGDEFLNLTSTAQGDVLMLDFTVRPHLEAVCVVDTARNGPSFNVDALKAGTYQVFAARGFYCAPGSPCPLLAIAPQLAGALVVGDGAAALREARGRAPSPAVPAGKAGAWGNWEVTWGGGSLGRGRMDARGRRIIGPSRPK